VFRCSLAITGMLITFSGLFLKNDVICYYHFHNSNYFPCAHLLLLQYLATSSVLRRFTKLRKATLRYVISVGLSDGRTRIQLGGFSCN